MKTTTTKIAWMTDLHMDRVEKRTRHDFLANLSDTDFDCAVVTGDISTSNRILEDLSALADACIKRNLYCVLGNHDFHGSSIGAVDKAVADLCRQRPNLHQLGVGKFHKLSSSLGLLGHRGWCDGRAGLGRETRISSSDFDLIADFRNSSKEGQFATMEKLGRESARYIRKELPYALAATEHVVCATHFPPFYQSSLYDGRICGFDRQPHFTNISMGHEILAACKKRSYSRTTVLCGHTHCPVDLRMGGNIQVRVGYAKPKKPRFEILNFS